MDVDLTLRIALAFALVDALVGCAPIARTDLDAAVVDAGLVRDVGIPGDALGDAAIDLSCLGASRPLHLSHGSSKRTAHA